MGSDKIVGAIGAFSSAVDLATANLQNSNTAGFLKEATKMESIVIDGKVSGVVHKRLPQFDVVSPITPTTSVLDIAVSGLGFLPFSQNGSTVYGRCAHLAVDNNNNLIDEDGNKLQGILTVAGADVAPSSLVPEKLTDIPIPLAGMSATTTQVNVAGWNLPSEGGTPPIIPNNTPGKTATMVGTDVSVVSTRGISFTMKMQLTYEGIKTISGTSGSVWSIAFTNPSTSNFIKFGSSNATTTDGTDFGLTAATDKLCFVSGAGGVATLYDWSGSVGGAGGTFTAKSSPVNCTINLDQTLVPDTIGQVAFNFSNVGMKGMMQSIEQPQITTDGKVYSRRDSLFVDQNGYVSVRYQSGNVDKIALLPIVAFNNTNGLARVDGTSNFLQVTGSSGAMSLLFSGDRGGSLLSSATADSTVNSTEEMLNAISGSKSIQSESAILKQDFDNISSIIQTVRAG